MTEESSEAGVLLKTKALARKLLCSRLKGKFIAFDGICGSGKSTIVGRLIPWLRDLNMEMYNADTLAPDCAVEGTREPGGTEYGEQIRNILIDPGLKSRGALDPYAEAMLFMAARRQLVMEKIIPLRKAGYTIVADRWVSSTFANQGTIRNVPWEMIKLLYDMNMTDEIMRPNHVFILDIPPSVAMERQRSRPAANNHFHQQDEAYYARWRDGYLRYVDTYPRDASVIDVRGSVEEVMAKIHEALRLVFVAGRAQ